MLLSLQVNNENVVKVGHRQVVNMIRQGGSHLILKVVTVTRNLDPDDTARKKGVCPLRCPAEWGAGAMGRTAGFLMAESQGNGVWLTFATKAMTLNLSLHSATGGHSWAIKGAPSIEQMSLPP